MERDGFLFEMQRLHIEMERVVRKYGVEDDYIGMVLSGLKVIDNEGHPSVRAIYSYSIEDYDTLDEMIDFMGADVYIGQQWVQGEQVELIKKAVLKIAEGR